MSTLGIYTVKNFRLHEGRYYTYGGFGDYLSEIRKYFDKVILVAHVRRAAPLPGWYHVPDERLEIVHLPVLPTEAGVLLTIPAMIAKALAVTRRMDVVHARMPDYTGVIGAAVAGLYGVPCFNQIVDDWYVLAKATSPWKRYGLGIFLRLHLFLYDRMERLVCRNRMVFAQGQTCYAKHAASSDCEEVLSSAHHPSDIVPPQRKFQAPPYTILNVGRLQAVKNQALILEALARLNAQTPDWRAVLVGTGSHETDLRERAGQLGVSQWVSFTGQIAHGPELWKQFDAADVFVLSSISEGTPKVVLEAMARGLPVVASAISGVPTAVAHEQRGLLFESRDVEGLVASLQRMRSDAELRERCQSQASRFALVNTVEEATRSMLRKVFRKWPQLEDTVGARSG